MGSVCGTTLALLDAGVPIKDTVAGIAMGMIADGDNHAILSDILGSEDHHGDMDFKVAGTREGITAIQMDIKVKGLKPEVLQSALDQARDGHLHILDRMAEALSEPRENLSPYAPANKAVIIPTDKPDSGIAIWAKSTTSGLAVVLGLVNAPIPLPPGSDEELDLSGSGTVYGDPGTIFPLGIYLAGSTSSFTLTAPSGFPLRIERRNDITVPVASGWTITNAGSPWLVSGDAVGASNVLYKRVYGSTDDSAMTNGRLRLMKGVYLITDPLGLTFKQTTDDGTTQAPPSIRMTFNGKSKIFLFSHPCCLLTQCIS